MTTPTYCLPVTIGQHVQAMHVQGSGVDGVQQSNNGDSKKAGAHHLADALGKVNLRQEAILMQPLSDVSHTNTYPCKYARRVTPDLFYAPAANRRLAKLHRGGDNRVEQLSNIFGSERRGR